MYCLKTVCQLCVYNVTCIQVRDYFLEAETRQEMDDWVTLFAQVCGFSPGLYMYRHACAVSLENTHVCLQCLCNHFEPLSACVSDA